MYKVVVVEEEEAARELALALALTQG
eukprot:COSAG02_NODE_35797_length_463_cov_0.837912_1_plen_25_part_01